MALFDFRRDRTRIVEASRALPGRTNRMPVPRTHAMFTDRPIAPPFPDGMRTAVFGMGCFRGAERPGFRSS
ncbi:hypothetical protein [Actinophytocola sp.]|uniref:hypothetical protein n=1 Tax=Actinophytocola sp. TaxID=1872138 RepID=UPI003D6A4F63